jgi:cell division transport system permease protein
MKGRSDHAGALAEYRVLRESRVMGPMPWVLAILMFMTVLAAAAGLSTALAAYGLSKDVAQRMTVQIVEANPDIRRAQTQVVAARLKGMDSVLSVDVVDDDRLGKLVEPWLGSDGAEAGLPYPSLIDIALRPGARLDMAAIGADLRARVPSVHVEPDSQWLRPLVQLLALVGWLALAIVLLMMVAVSAAVILAARAALNTHRDTIDILHLMGSSDTQIARLFQRRIVIDALMSGVIGLVTAVLVLIGVNIAIQQTGSDFLGSSFMPFWVWPALLVLPGLATALANSAARITVLRVLRRIL